jgi:hypothetical protein
MGKQTCMVQVRSEVFKPKRAKYKVNVFPDGIPTEYTSDCIMTRLHPDLIIAHGRMTSNLYTICNSNVSNFLTKLAHLGSASKDFAEE